MTLYAPDLDGDLRDILDRWRQRCMVPAAQQARADARAALMRAVENAAAEMQRHPATAWSLRAGGALAAATAVLVPIGWNAPAGTPLHLVRSTREHLSTMLAGSGAERLRLDYAENALDDARTGNDREANLEEAQGWLDEAEQNLPANPNQVMVQRIDQDRAWLSSQQTSTPAGMAVTTQPVGSMQPQPSTASSAAGNPRAPAALPPPSSRRGVPADSSHRESLPNRSERSSYRANAPVTPDRDRPRHRDRPAHHGA